MSRQAIIRPSLDQLDIIRTSIPIPEDKEIVIKVAVSGSNPKDWKIPLWKNWPQNSGDDIAGIVHSVGKDVYEFKPGDRVAALHQFQKPNGSFADYAVAPDTTTFHIPSNVSFEEAATIPLAALTAAVALFLDMKFPAPYDLSAEQLGKVPFVIYGITSAVGAFAAKFARISGIGPIIGVAGRAEGYAKTLADYYVDYREGEDSLVKAIENILAKETSNSKAPYVFDAISSNGSLEATLRFLDPNGGTVSTVLPPLLFAKDSKNFEYPPGVTAYNSSSARVHSTHKDFGCIWSRYIGRLLQDGRLKAHPYEVISGGLNGILTGLQLLRDGKASAIKYVYRIDETKDHGNRDLASVRIQPAPSSHPLRNFPFPAIDE